MEFIFNDLLYHQSWADAESWKAFERFPGALNDEILIDRLFHIHTTQRAFIDTVKDNTFNMPERDDFSTIKELKRYALETHEIIFEYLENLPSVRLEEGISIPWFENPPLMISRAQALTQMATHSHYHRGQNAIRFRDLGGEPPFTDLIVWYWKDKPEAEW